MNVTERINLLKKMVKEAEKITSWQEAIYTQLNVLAGKSKAGSVTDTTDAGGEIAVAFDEAFASTPVVIVQLEEDVNYYSVITARDVNGFTVKILDNAGNGLVTTAVTFSYIAMIP
ncbi:unnamed protein product [marine sediment metagenome]|uniref:Uncharacterized protein n=1 Tax=marine sediment metagenome TaxID=412755 RepID=X1QSL9_9ZZZZ